MCALLAASLAWAAPQSDFVDTAPLNRDGAVRAAFARLYDLDFEGACSGFEKVADAHPQDPLAVDYLLNVTLYQSLYRLNLLDTTLYAHDGFLRDKRPVAADSRVTAQINALADKAIGLADARLHADAQDTDALFARAWARSLRAVYLGLIQHSFLPALHQALQARGDDDKVLQRDLNYVDAELVVGVHQYIIGALPMGFKIMAGLAGIHGDKAKGIALLRDDGQRGVITSVEARTVLMLFLRREVRYAEAADLARSLAQQYPHNFLFALEEANLDKDAGAGDAAVATYRKVLRLSRTPGYYPNQRLDLAWFGLAETLRGHKADREAAEAFRQAIVQPGIAVEMKRRSQLALGEEYDMLHQRAKAVEAYRRLVAESPDSPQATEARRDLQTPFEM